jgi:hypothetical protein
MDIKGKRIRIARSAGQFAEPSYNTCLKTFMQLHISLYSKRHMLE